jgi:hypothetical protein
MSGQHDLLGLVLEHTQLDEYGEERLTRGRCVGAWPDGEWLIVALEQDDGEIFLRLCRFDGRLRILRGKGRKVPLA